MLGVNKQAVNLAVFGELGICTQYLFLLLNQRLNTGSTYANLIWTFIGNINRYFDSKSTLLFTIFSDKISLQCTRIGLTHISKSLNSTYLNQIILFCIKLMKPTEVYSTALRHGSKYFWIIFISPMLGIIKVLCLTSENFTTVYQNWFNTYFKKFEMG
jgi:hypothetical protein